MTSSALEEGEIPAELDFDRRGAAVTRFEIPLLGGEYFGDKMDHSFIVGSGLYVHLTDALSLGADFGYSRVNYDPKGEFGSAVTDNNLYLTGGTFKIALPGAYRSGKKIREVDFYTLIGGGAIRISNSFRGAGTIGGGMKIYTGAPWFSFITEVREYFFTVPTASGSAFETDMVLLLGPSFLIPPWVNHP